MSRQNVFTVIIIVLQFFFSFFHRSVDFIPSNGVCGSISQVMIQEPWQEMCWDLGFSYLFIYLFNLFIYSKNTRGTMKEEKQSSVSGEVRSLESCVFGIHLREIK